jgi:Leucine-rich repeat (LRR) protein
VLRHSKSTEISSETYKIVPSLEVIIFTNSNLQRLDQKTFSHFENLKYLDLSSNAFAEIRNGIFKKNSKLIYLNLSNNKISRVGVEVFVNLINLKEISFNGNLCDKNYEDKAKIYSVCDVKFSQVVEVNNK